MSTELATIEKRSAIADLAYNVAPKTYAELVDMTMKFSNTEFVPKAYIGKPDSILVASMWGAQLGMSPMTSIQNLCVINGKPSLYGDAMVGVVRASGKLEYLVETWDATTQTAICKVKRVGQPENVETFSMEDAKKAGLFGKSGPWSQYPRRMCKFRARGFALRDTFADVLMGIVSAEEAADMPAPKDVSIDVVDTRPNAPMTRAEAKEIREEENNFATNDEKNKFQEWASRNGFSGLITLEEQTTIAKGVSREWIEFLCKDLKTRKLTKATPAAEAEPAPVTQAERKVTPANETNDELAGMTL